MIKKNAKKSKAVSRARHRTGPYRIARSRTGLGLIAVEPIRKGKFIIEYRGRIRLWKNIEDIWNKYLFEIDKKWALDGSSRSNIARYINHSCRPNAEVRIYARRIRIYATRTIPVGREITYDYGEEYFDEILKPIGCKCNACTAKRRRRRQAARHA